MYCYVLIYIFIIYNFDYQIDNTNCTTLYILKNCYEYAINIFEIDENVCENGEIVWSKVMNNKYIKKII